MAATSYKSMAGRLELPLLRALEQRGYQNMTPVQHKVLHELPSFQADCLVQAKTGTGKTVAFLLPALQTLLAGRAAPSGGVSILVISPTRELATQIKGECDMLTSQLNHTVQCHTAYGGTKKEKHLQEFLNVRPAVLVATPGRLNDYLDDALVAARFANLRTLILDEADTMLEAGFLPAINNILRRVPPKSTGWQGMCFSATVPTKMKQVLGMVLRPGYTSISTIDPNEVPTIEQVDQYSIILSSASDTFASLAAVIQQERSRVPTGLKAIIFGTTANGVALMHDMFKLLLDREIKVYELHSRLSQAARTRTTEEFKAASSGLMFASDVIGRGMDFPNVDVVVQVGLPSSGDQYVHRVGRTARAGSKGRAVILLTDREKYFIAVNKHLPIQQYAVEISASVTQLAPQVTQALVAVDGTAKAKAYQAYLGFHKTFTKQLRLDNAGLVALANEYAFALGCSEPPMIDKMVVGKMGLRGTPGLNVGVVQRFQKSSRPTPGGGSKHVSQDHKVEDGSKAKGIYRPRRSANKV